MKSAVHLTMSLLSLPVSASVWLRPQAAATIRWSARPSISLGASRRLVSPWPSCPLSLRPGKQMKKIWLPACVQKQSHIRSIAIRPERNPSTHPSSTACPQRWWANYEQNRDPTPHSWPGHHSDSRSGEDPTGSGPDYGKQLQTQRQHLRDNIHTSRVIWWAANRIILIIYSLEKCVIMFIISSRGG